MAKEIDTAEALAEAHEQYVAALLEHVAANVGTDVVEDEEEDDERREELLGLTLAELRKQAKAAGASAADVKKAGSEKEALADLILELEDEDDEDDEDEDDEDEDDEDDEDEDDEDDDDDDEEEDEAPTKSKRAPAKRRR